MDTFNSAESAGSDGSGGDGSAGVRLLGPGEIRELAAELDVTPTKRLGQNFVIDPNTVRRIVTAADLAEDDHVVEVGPGLGSLTLALLEAVGQLTVVEIDPRLAGRLERTVGEFALSRADDLTVVTSDALKIAADNPAFVDTPPTALVANLPYNVSVPVLLHLLEIFPSIRRVLVMVQLEVADRLAADPGSKVYGVPSVKAGFYGRVRRAGVIGKNVFWPAPKIDSGLVRIDRWADEDRPWQTELERLGRTSCVPNSSPSRMPPSCSVARPCAPRCPATSVPGQRLRRSSPPPVSTRGSAARSWTPPHSCGWRWRRWIGADRREPPGPRRVHLLRLRGECHGAGQGQPAPLGR